MFAQTVFEKPVRTGASFNTYCKIQEQDNLQSLTRNNLGSEL